LALQILCCGGTKDESAELWIHKVERLARIYEASDEVTLLAATTKLVKLAKDWFDIKTGDINLWTTFKQALLSRFKSYVSALDRMHKAEELKWNSSKQTFQEYVSQKLTILESFNFADREVICFVIDGITDRFLRTGASAIRANTIDQFL